MNLGKTFAFTAAGLTAAALVLTSLPIRPVFITTASIPRGLYLINTQDKDPQRGQLVAFRYTPPAWAQGRAYARPREILIKAALGLPNDVLVQAGTTLSICPQNPLKAACSPVGDVHVTDSKGKTLTPFPFGKTLPPHTIFAGTTAPRSYDSRYFGPIHYREILGTARPVFTID